MSNRTNTTAFDVANYIVNLSRETGEPVTNMKLQKLIYYSYAWFLVEKEGADRLFGENIEAWKYGPVVNDVYETYKDFGADNIKEARGGDPSNLSSDEKELIYEVFTTYGAKSALELVSLTHAERPWVESYEEGVDHKVIPDDLIFGFYSDMKQKSQAQ